MQQIIKSNGKNHKNVIVNGTLNIIISAKTKSHDINILNKFTNEKHAVFACLSKNLYISL